MVTAVSTNKSEVVVSKPILGIAIAAAVLLAACSSSGSGTADESGTQPPPGASATVMRPRAEQTAWAGNVCTAAADLKTSVEGLATAATSGDGDVQSSLAAQFTTIKSSADTVVNTLADPPAANADDPDVAAVQSAADELRTSITALETSVQDAAGASGAADTLTALAVWPPAQQRR